MGEADEEVHRSDRGEVCLFCSSFLACLSIYLPPNREFKYRELYYAGGPCGDILRSQHLLPSDPFLVVLPEHFQQYQRIVQVVYKPGIHAPRP